MGKGFGVSWIDRYGLSDTRQLTVLLPQDEVDDGISGELAEAPPGILGVHMQPRRDGIVLGGTSERGVWSLEPNHEAMQLLVSAHMAVYSAMPV